MKSICWCDVNTQIGDSRCVICGYMFYPERTGAYVCPECGIASGSLLGLKLEQPPKICSWSAYVPILVSPLLWMASWKVFLDTLPVILLSCAILCLPPINRGMVWLWRWRHTAYVAAADNGLILGRLHGFPDIEIVPWREVEHSLQQGGICEIIDKVSNHVGNNVSVEDLVKWSKMARGQAGHDDD